MHPLNMALCGNRLLDAIVLQADRLGAEIRCPHCGGEFVFSQCSSIRRMRRTRSVCMMGAD